jgi:histidinol dehydrogenase
MQVIRYPDRKDWPAILQRPYADNTSIMQSVQEILREVKERGDKAVSELTQKFTGVALKSLEVSEEEMNTAASLLTAELKDAIQQAKKNIEAFHQAQLGTVEVIQTVQGIQCWRKSVGIEKVGLLHTGWNSATFFNGINAGHSGKVGRL